MKTSEEIKKALRMHFMPSHPRGCIGCAYRNKAEHAGECVGRLYRDTVEYIEQLEAQVPEWIPVTERLPENDVPVLVSAKRKDWKGKEYRIVFTAFHTDGTTHTEDSGYGWDLEDTGLMYCEETDDYIIPEAWWEDVTFAEEFSKVYDATVTHWMPLPNAPEEVV